MLRSGEQKINTFFKFHDCGLIAFLCKYLLYELFLLLKNFEYKSQTELIFKP